MMERENCRCHDYVNIVMTRLVGPKKATCYYLWTHICVE
jgi:hypothetical protein